MEIMKNGHDKIKRHGARLEKGRQRALLDPGYMRVPELKDKLEQKANGTTDTVIITPTTLEQWKMPPFQRPLRVNTRVQEVAEQIKRDEGIVPGMLTIGVLDGKMYIVDGQHRTHALRLAMEAGIKEGLAEIRVVFFDTMAEMAEEYVRLNSSLVKMRPDDVLRGMEGSIQALQILRNRCEFVGYDNIRRGAHNAILSMSAVLRVWHAATADTPSGAGGGSALSLAQSMTTDEANLCADFLLVCEKAWGRDPEYSRLWGALNLSLCGWLYRRTVVAGYSVKSLRLTKDAFRSCIQALSTRSEYLDWLLGRALSDRDRSPCYDRMKRIFVKRIADDGGRKPVFPAPAWAVGHSRKAM